jgi:hypothetical protein
LDLVVDDDLNVVEDCVRVNDDHNDDDDDYVLRHLIIALYHHFYHRNLQVM